MTAEKPVSGFNLAHVHAEHSLHRILNSALGQRRQNDHRSPASSYWDAEFFGLHRVALFQSATPDEQAAILHLANQSLLEEAYWIEKAGMGYMAKMILLAETIEERMLYSLFAADESRHLSQIQEFIINRPAQANQPFLNLLEELVEIPDKTALLFAVQVVLEGWGLTHYRRLAKGCCDRAIAHLFMSFLQAESRHHSTGVTLFNQIQIADTSRAALTELLAQFLFMVQVGPQSILAALEQVKEDLSRTQKIRILEELNTEVHSGTRLKTLKSLMQLDGSQTIVQSLEEQGCFTPFSASKCV